MTDDERRRYANKKKTEHEKHVRFWTRLCQKLAQNKDFTPIEMEEVDIVLKKEYPLVKDYSTVKMGLKDGQPVLVEKLKMD